MASEDSCNEHDEQGHDQKDEQECVVQGEVHSGSSFGCYARFFFECSCVYRTIGRIGMEVSWNGACTRQRKGFLFKVLEAKRTDYWWSVRLGLSDQLP